MEENKEILPVSKKFHTSSPTSISEMDYIDRSKTIVEQVKKVDIIITDEKSGFYIEGTERSKRKVTINIPPIERCEELNISQRIGFNHETAHIFFDTFGLDWRDIRDTLVVKARAKGIVPYSYSSETICKAFDHIFNVIEDQRVESNLGNIYLGMDKEFKEARKNIGKSSQEGQSPLHHIYNKRMYRDDLIPKEYIKDVTDIIQRVELTSGEASIILSESYIENSVFKYMEEHTTKTKDGTCVGDNELDKAIEWACNMYSKSDNNKYSRGRGNAKTIQDKDIKITKKRGQKDINELKHKIEKFAREAKYNTMPNGDKIIKDDSRYNPVTIVRHNSKIANGINKTLRLLQAKKKPKPADYGDNLDMAQVIKAKCMKQMRRLYITQKRKTSLTMVVSIDGSGSMGGEPLDKARNMMATMYKAIEKIEGVTLKGIIWGGDDSACGVTDINNIHDCKHINPSRTYGGTPTRLAVEYSCRVLERMKGRNKILIVITDGSPNGGYSACELVKEEVNRGRKLGMTIVGGYIGSSGTNEAMGVMFGNGGYVNFNNMDKASIAIITGFKNILMKQFKGRK